MNESKENNVINLINHLKKSPVLNALKDKVEQIAVQTASLRHEPIGLDDLVSKLSNDTDKEILSLKSDLAIAKKEIDKQNGFVEKFHGGLYVGVFLFAIFQGIVMWWVNDSGDQVKKIKDSVEMLSNRVIVLETKKVN